MSEVKLKEILHPKMDILFLALNPPSKSNSNAHYFSASRSFWNLLLKSGLITQAVKSPLTGDEEVFKSNRINYKNWIYGITDLCHDVVETNSSKVSVKDWRVNRILKIITDHKIKKLCIIHGKVGKAFEKLTGIDRSLKYGKIGKIGETDTYEMPFHNASIPEKENEYRKLINN